MLRVRVPISTDVEKTRVPKSDLDGDTIPISFALGASCTPSIGGMVAHHPAEADRDFLVSSLWPVVA